MQTNIEKKLHEIAEVLFGEMNKGTLDKQKLGLYDGMVGIIIFCKYYLQYFPTQTKKKILDNYVELFSVLVVSKIEHFSYCSGLIGILDGLKHLNNEGLLSIDYSDIENKCEKYLQELSIFALNHNKYDFMHGGLGAIKYFANNQEFINLALDILENVAFVDDKKYKWLSSINLKGDYGYNISLSHGCASIVSVLSCLNSLGINLDKRNRIIENACNYILSQEINPNEYGCFFPSMSKESDEKKYPSRMGWCYGDLGISTSLWQAGKLLNNHDWQDKAMKVFAFSANRRDYRNCGIFDFGLCHGTTSICMMFHYMYLQTGDMLFKDTRDYWANCTLEMGHLGGGLAGFRAWSGEKQEYVNEYGMLEGISGIGLMLLTLLQDKTTEAKWMKFFMLN